MGMLEFLTLLLAIATFFLGWQTYKMAKATQDMVKVEKLPQVAFIGLTHQKVTYTDLSTIGIKVGLILKNTGKVLIKYDINPDTLSVVVQNRTPSKPVFFNYGGYIFPGQTTTFYYNAIDNIDINSLLEGKFKYDLNYNSIPPSNPHSSQRELTFQIPSIDETSISWMHIKENEN